MPTQPHPMLARPTRCPRLSAIALALLGFATFSCAQDSEEEPPSQSGDASAGHAGTSGSGGSGGQAGSGGSGGTGVPCTTGVAESTGARCSDACDNDVSGSTDCDDVNCCAVRLDCDSATHCGQQPTGNAWDGYLDFDDAQLDHLDPSTLPAGVQPCHAPSLVRVEFAVDGDTLDVTDVLGGDTSGRLRVIGVDTPETSHGATPADCYANEAASFTSQLAGHVVWLTFDAECRDAYDRLLAYVHIGAGKNDSLERQLLRRGLARAYPFGDNRTFEELFDADEREAMDSGLGLWGACP